MSSTHTEREDGVVVTIQHCEGCDRYLGVNYPSLYCKHCTPLPRLDDERVVRATTEPYMTGSKVVVDHETEAIRVTPPPCMVTHYTKPRIIKRRGWWTLLDKAGSVHTEAQTFPSLIKAASKPHRPI